jgi:hypothetical protein
LSDVVRVDIFDPRTVKCIISTSPKRVNPGNESEIHVELIEGKMSGKELMIEGGNVLGRALWLAKVVIGGRNGVRAACPICSKDREVGLSADVRVFGRDARKHVKVSFLDVSPSKAGELDLHSKSATGGGKIVAPLRDSQKTVRGARSTSLNRDVR